MFEIETTGSGIVDMAVSGELDMHRAPQMRAALTAVLNRGDVTAINLDLSAVTVLDATGVGTIIVAHRIATNVRVDLRLTAVSPLAARLLSLTGAEALLPAAPAMRPAPPPTTRAGARRVVPSRRSPPDGHAGDPDRASRTDQEDSGAGPGYAGYVCSRRPSGRRIMERQEAAYILGPQHSRGSTGSDPHAPTPDDAAGDVLAQGTSS
jgi:anti-sigma B factor antagonist